MSQAKKRETVNNQIMFCGCRITLTSGNIVVHDRNVVEKLGKFRDVGAGVTISASPRGDGGRCSENELLAGRILTELFQELEEVGSIIW